MSQQFIMPKALQRRHCYTMADVIAGRNSGDESQTSKQELMKNPLIKSLIRGHALTTDATSNLTEATNIILEASSGSAIGRSMVRVIETLKQSVQIRKPRFLKAVNTSRSQKGASGGERNEYLTINVDKEIEASDLWDKQFLEDADYDVASSEARALGINHDVNETTKIIDFINNIPSGDIAGGANFSAITPNTFTFNDIVNLWNQVVRTDFTPNILVMHTDQLADLMKTDEFKDQQQLGQFFHPESGKFGRLIMGLEILSSSLMTPGTVFVLNSNDVAMYPVRRDKMLDSFQPTIKEFEMQITTRYGIDVGRPEELARMINA